MKLLHFLQGHEPKAIWKLIELKLLVHIKKRSRKTSPKGCSAEHMVNDRMYCLQSHCAHCAASSQSSNTFSYSAWAYPINLSVPSRISWHRPYNCRLVGFGLLLMRSGRRIRSLGLNQVFQPLGPRIMFVKALSLNLTIHAFCIE